MRPFRGYTARLSGALRRLSGKSGVPQYDVAHTTLGRYFERPEVAKQLLGAARQLRAEQRAAAARRAAERRLDQDVRRRAREQAAAEREQARQARAAVAAITSRARRTRSPYGAWLDERDLRRPLTRAELHSTADEIAAFVVAAGRGMQAVVDATGFHTRENVVRGIDPAILTQAFDNDLLAQAQPPPRPPARTVAARQCDNATVGDREPAPVAGLRPPERVTVDATVGSR